MNMQQKPPLSEPRPFSMYLNGAAQADPLGRFLTLPPRGNTMLRTTTAHIRSALICGWRWFQQSRASGSAARRLHVTETVSLGEKRFVSIVQVDETQFLIGSSGTCVQMLAQLQSRSAKAAPVLITTQELT